MKSTPIMACVGAVTLFISHGAAQDANTSAESTRIAVQEICPVSGEKLTARGGPVKAKVGEEDVYLCCSDCLTGDVKPEHWLTIHKNMAKAQRLCPVMEKKLPKKPKWTILDGRLFFVCCPPCIDDIRAEPEKFKNKLDALYAESLLIQ